jgi:hypothetical protein
MEESTHIRDEDNWCKNVDNNCNKRLQYIPRRLGKEAVGQDHRIHCRGHGNRSQSLVEKQSIVAAEVEQHGQSVAFDVRDLVIAMKIAIAWVQTLKLRSLPLDRQFCAMSLIDIDSDLFEASRLVVCVKGRVAIESQ